MIHAHGQRMNWSKQARRAKKCGGDATLGGLIATLLLISRISVRTEKAGASCLSLEINQAAIA